MFQLRSIFHNGRAVRLIIAFLIGIPLGLLAGKIGGEMENVVPYLLFPLLLGVLSAFTIRARTLHPHLLALGTGLLAWGGVGVALLVMTAQETLAPCSTGNCASTTANVLGAWLIFYLLSGLLLTSLGAVTSSVLLRR